MYFKVLCLAALAITVSAQSGYDNSFGSAFSSNRIARHDGHPEIVPGHDHDYHTHPKYDFEYKVSDEHTGDMNQTDLRELSTTMATITPGFTLT